MKFLTSCLRNNPGYFISIALLTDIVFVLYLAFPKESFFISLSSPHPVWLNVFCINYTFMGDGFFAFALALFVWGYLKKRDLAIRLLSGFLLTEGIIQILKNILAESMPQLFFEQGQYLFFNDESILANTHGMPSGHTAIAFALATVLVVHRKNSKWAVPLLIAGIIMAFTRMYLAQDYLVEVVSGMLIGTSSALMSMSILKFKLPIRISYNRWKGVWGKRGIHSTELQPG
jgi:membrane-associated phospholipid phosphatase